MGRLYFGKSFFVESVFVRAVEISMRGYRAVIIVRARSCMLGLAYPVSCTLPSFIFTTFGGLCLRSCALRKPCRGLCNCMCTSRNEHKRLEGNHDEYWYIVYNNAKKKNKNSTEPTARSVLEQWAVVNKNTTMRRSRKCDLMLPHNGYGWGRRVVLRIELLEGMGGNRVDKEENRVCSLVRATATTAMNPLMVMRWTRQDGQRYGRGGREGGDDGGEGFGEERRGA